MNQNLIIISILSILLVVNITALIIWYLRKTATIEFKVKRFVKRNKMTPRLAKQTVEIHPDAMEQLFLRDNNEELRDSFKSEHVLKEFLELIDTHLNKKEGKYLVNIDSPYLNRPAPTAPPIEDPDGDLIEL